MLGAGFARGLAERNHAGQTNLLHLVVLLLPPPFLLGCEGLEWDQSATEGSQAVDLGVARVLAAVSACKRCFFGSTALAVELLHVVSVFIPEQDE
jgi:hypothetical protein